MPSGAAIFAATDPKCVLIAGQWHSALEYLYERINHHGAACDCGNVLLFKKVGNEPLGAEHRRRERRAVVDEQASQLVRVDDSGLRQVNDLAAHDLVAPL